MPANTCGSDLLNERYCYTEENGEIRASPGLDRPPRTTRVSAKKTIVENFDFCRAEVRCVLAIKFWRRREKG